MNNSNYYHEYRAEFWEDMGNGTGLWKAVCRDVDTKGWTTIENNAREEQRQARADGLKTRLVRRSITKPEVVE